MQTLSTGLPTISMTLLHSEESSITTFEALPPLRTYQEIHRHPETSLIQAGCTKGIPVQRSSLPPINSTHHVTIYIQ